MATCSITGCSGPLRGKGLCNKHYMRQYRADVTSERKEVPDGPPMLWDERHPRIRSDAAPPRMGKVSALEQTVRKMVRGDWVHVSHAQARSMQRIVRRLGGNSTWYRTSDTFSCFKVLDAPWISFVQAA
jgi:hypothetical protein